MSDNAFAPDEVASSPGRDGCEGARPGVVAEVRRLTDGVEEDS